MVISWLTIEQWIAPKVICSLLPRFLGLIVNFEKSILDNLIDAEYDKSLGAMRPKLTLSLGVILIS